MNKENVEFSDEKKKVFKQRFDDKINELYNNDRKNSYFLTKIKINELIEKIKRCKFVGYKKHPNDYYLLQHYDVLNVNGIEKLILPISEKNQSIKYYCSAEELFDTLFQIHKNIGHGGRDRMIKEIKRQYKNITYDHIRIFLSYCEVCQQKKGCARKGVVVNPILSPHMNSRCQVDLIDFQSQPDGEYRFIFVYQDHLTKFVILRPLERKTAELVAEEVNNNFFF